jgi:hypothetical protein
VTYDDTIAALALIVTFFPHTFEVADELMIGMWHRELEPYNAQDVEVAVRDLCRTKEKFPTLKDVLDRLGANRGATTAWLEACRYASEWGLGDEAVKKVLVEDPNGDKVVNGKRVRVVTIENPGLPDPALKAAVEAVGGVQAIRRRTTDDEPAMRAHFFRAFDEAKVQVAAGKLTQLPAARSGHQVLGPVDLTDAIKAIGRPVPLPSQGALEREGGAA